MIDFFKNDCHSLSRESVFGIIDDTEDENSPAFIDIENPKRWNIKINNPQKSDVNHYAIDKCIVLYKEDGKSHNRICDSMLSWKKSIAFMEYKDKNKRAGIWIPDSLEQVEITIKFFMLNYDYTKFSRKEAYLINRKKPIVPTSYMEVIKSFYKTYGFVLRINQTVEVI